MNKKHFSYIHIFNFRRLYNVVYVGQGSRMGAPLRFRISSRREAEEYTPL